MTITTPHAITSSLTDAHGNPTSGPAEAVATYDAAVDRLVRWHPDVLTHTETLATTQPRFAMGHALGAYLSLVSSDPMGLPNAAAAAEALRQTAGNERERAHSAAVDAWLAGDWHGASRLLDDLLIRWPADLLALALGHELDFFRGDAQNLRDRVGRSLPAFDPAHPHHGFVAGLYAFGLEECGHYERAEAAGCYAVDANPDDVWAIHAVAHTYEMRGRVDDGIRFLRDRVADWGDGNFLAVHNWWHYALYLLEAGLPGEALAIYDARIHHAESTGVMLELVDASAMLWRLLLDGVDTGGRFAALTGPSTRTRTPPIVRTRGAARRGAMKAGSEEPAFIPSRRSGETPDGRASARVRAARAPAAEGRLQVGGVDGVAGVVGQDTVGARAGSRQHTTGRDGQGGAGGEHECDALQHHPAP